MRKNFLITTLAALTAGSMILLGGCSDVDITSINAEDTTLSAEIEASNLSDGEVTLHCIMYDSNGNQLPMVNVAFSSDEGALFTDTTGDDGSMGTVTLPCNTMLSCVVRNSEGTVLGQSDIVFKLSGDYSALTIYPPEEPDDPDSYTEQCVLEIPIDKTNLRAAIFITDDGYLNFANLTPYEDAQNTDIYASGSEDSTGTSIDDSSISGDLAGATDETADTGDETTEGDADTEDEASTDTDASDETTEDESTDSDTDTAEEETTDGDTEESADEEDSETTEDATTEDED